MAATRQLAAIMFTDIAGYTALMGADEQKAFALLEENRHIQRPIIERYNGRWIKELGDGILASFHAATEAVFCASAIQQACAAVSGLQLRIGIHLGEVVFENDDVFGDGVNIAARIQAIAPAGGTFISGPVYNNISNKKEIVTRFVKEELLKNVKDPIRIYEVLSAGKPQQDSHSIPLPVTAGSHAESSIAVLPFTNMSNDPEQDFFCDGMAEEVINALTQLENLRVVARTSAFSLKGKNLDVRQIGKMLEVNTLLEGSVRKAGNRLRISTKLVRADDGSHIWSQSYDRELEDVFAIQESIAANVATALRGVLTSKEKEAIRRPETTVEAYESYLWGRQLFHQLALKESKLYFEKAIALDPHYALAYAGLADVHSWLYEWIGADTRDLEAAESASRRALALAPYLSESHSSRGFVLALNKKYDEAEQEFKEAMRLNGNNFDTYYYYGRLCFARGRIKESAEWFQKASEVRREDFQSSLLLAQSLRVLGADPHAALEEGITRARKQLQLNPTDRRALSLTSGNLWDIGEREEARQWAEKALALYPEDVGVLVNAACLFAKDGDKEKALDLLEKAFGKGFGKRDWIEHDPDYDSLRDEPRFQAMLNHLK